jgi:hypothetical protein
MKRTIVTFEVEPDFKKYLEEQAIKNNVNRSVYIRNKLKRATRYKEKELI